MKKIIALIAALFMISILAGCVTTDVRLVQSQKYVVVEIDPKYLQDCPVEPPPSKKAYLEAGHDEREDMMTKVLLTQYQNTKICTADKRSIKELLEKQKETVEEANRKEEERIKKLGVDK